MKIREIISEGLYDLPDDFDNDQGLGDDFGDESSGLDEPEIDQLEADTNAKIVNTVIKVVRELIGKGHTDVDPTVITNQVVAATGKPFLLKDLIAVNNKSQEIQHYIDSINPTKVKFSSDILTVKNEDPNKETNDKSATIGAMAGRAASKKRGV